MPWGAFRDNKVCCSLCGCIQYSIGSGCLWANKKKIPFIEYLLNTVNSLNYGHPRDRELVSLIAKVSDNRNLFQSNACILFLLEV